MGASFSTRQGPYVANLVDLEVTTTDPKDLFLELVLLRRRVVEEEPKHIRLEKEKEQITLNTLIERDKFLSRMDFLQEQNIRD